VKIRTTTPADLDAIRQLFYDTVTQVNSRDYEPEQIEAWAAGSEKKEDWTQKMEEQYFLVAEAGDTIVGFCSLTRLGQLDFLYVHKDFQGMGIATKLLDTVIKIAEQMDMEVITSDVSITARPFFEKRGFQLMASQRVNLGGVLLFNFKMAQKVRHNV
jgi:putative acetyltransferase